MTPHQNLPGEPAGVEVARADGYDGSRHGSPFVHHAVICADPDGLAAEATRRLRRAAVAGGAVLAVLRPDVETTVCRDLGAAAVGVEFLPHADVLAGEVGRRHRRQDVRLRGLAGGGDAVTVVSQREPGSEEARDDPLGVRCLESEVLAGIDFDSLPIEQCCLYPGDRNRRLVRVARRTHPVVTDHTGAGRSWPYRTPASLAASDPALCHLDRDAHVRDVAHDGTVTSWNWLTSAVAAAGFHAAQAHQFGMATREAVRVAGRFNDQGRSRSGLSVRLYLHAAEDRLLCDVDAPALPVMRSSQLPGDPTLNFLWVAGQNRGGVSVRTYPLDDDRARIRVALQPS